MIKTQLLFGLGATALLASSAIITAAFGNQVRDWKLLARNVEKFGIQEYYIDKNSISHISPSEVKYSSQSGSRLKGIGGTYLSLHLAEPRDLTLNCNSKMVIDGQGSRSVSIREGYKYFNIQYDAAYKLLCLNKKSNGMPRLHGSKMSLGEAFPNDDYLFEFLSRDHDGPPIPSQPKAREEYLSEYRSSVCAIKGAETAWENIAIENYCKQYLSNPSPGKAKELN